MRRLIFFYFIVAFYSCNKGENTGPVNLHVIDNGGLVANQVDTAGVIVVNEGQFMRNNSSLSFIYSDSLEIINDVFFSRNQRDLGDVAQSAYIYNRNLYTVVNNSQKIEIVNAYSFASAGVINGFISPRYMTFSNHNKLFVSDLYANGVWIVDLNSNSVIKKISIHGWAEQLLTYGNKVFVTEMNIGKVYTIESNSDQVTDSLTLTKGANSIVMDKDNFLWVLCDGGYHEQVPKLYKIDPLNLEIVNSFSFSVQDSPMKLTVNEAGDKLFFINTNIYSMDITASSLPGSPLISARSSQIFYALGVSPRDEKIYVGDAKDYQQKGYVYRYARNGLFQDSMLVGVIPSMFCFR